MYDTLTKKEVFVQCPVLCVVCDNPRASEFTHHLGSSALHFCRACDVGFVKLSVKLISVAIIPFRMRTIIYTVQLHFLKFRQRRKMLQI